jgi:arsenate reductase
MAEGFARQLAAFGWEIFSAGTAPKPIHPMAARVMLEAGIDISAQSAKSLAAVPLDRIDQIVTLCGEAAEQCPTLPRQVQRSHWPIADPALAQGSEEEVLTEFRKIRDEIRARVESLFAAERV